MASLEDRLRRTDWDPNAGDTLIGTIVKTSERETQYGPYPLLVIRTDDGTEYNVHCLRGGLASPVIKQQPSRGDRIGIRYNGTVPQRGDSSKEVHRYIVAFEKEDESEPDWDRMENQRRNRGDTSTDSVAVASNGGDIVSPSSVNKTWGKDANPWATQSVTDDAPF